MIDPPLVRLKKNRRLLRL